MSRVGVFGGTFDPVHVGHLAIASAALESISLDRVLFVLARRSPLKDRSPVASESDRLEMLRLAVAGEPRFDVSRIELDREGPSYTVETLERLSGPDELFLVLGADALADIRQWHRPERILELATIVVAARPGAPTATAADRRLMVDTPLCDISSRELRARAARGRSLRYLVPDNVWRYIEDRGLYRAEATPRTS